MSYLDVLLYGAGVAAVLMFIFNVFGDVEEAEREGLGCDELKNSSVFNRSNHTGGDFGRDSESDSDRDFDDSDITAAVVTATAFSSMDDGDSDWD